MKNISRYLLTLCLAILYSCSQDFLEEEPRDFLTTGNAFRDIKDFDASVNNLYRLTRDEFYTSNLQSPLVYISGTDLFTYVVPNIEAFGTYNVTLDPTSRIVSYTWESWYKIIAESNTILSRLPTSALSSSEKLATEAKARFFRGLAYRTLAYLYGGVPLVLEETITVKTDFVRATRKEVYAQVIEDLKFAAENLPGITQVRDGEVSNLAAYHLLSEVYIADEQYANAIAAATMVIDDPATALMTTRFGRRAGEPGDVYWDLFQRGNQNRASGNTEGIWVIQLETDVPGGANVTSGFNGGYQLERAAAPQSNTLRIQNVPALLYPTSTNTGGRGVGLLPSLKYFTNTIWASDFNNDIRNSRYNFIREYVVDAPGHPNFGQAISTENPPAGIRVPSRNIYAFQAKITTPGDHPDPVYLNKNTQQLSNAAGATYADQYLFRLAETYLLRAEAHLRNGDAGSAAADINMLRNRANASLVEPGAVTIDYILDERLREFGVEEKRRLTLQRMGKLYERVRLSHPPRDQANGLNTNYDNIQPHYELWPIPFSAIEANTGAVLEQNPGYN